MIRKKRTWFDISSFLNNIISLTKSENVCTSLEQIPNPLLSFRVKSLNVHGNLFKNFSPEPLTLFKLRSWQHIIVGCYSAEWWSWLVLLRFWSGEEKKEEREVKEMGRGGGVFIGREKSRKICEDGRKNLRAEEESQLGEYQPVWSRRETSSVTSMSSTLLHLLTDSFSICFWFYVLDAEGLGKQPTVSGYAAQQPSLMSLCSNYVATVDPRWQRN